MQLAWSKELMVIADESREVAQRLGQLPTSGHMLLCLFTLKNRASLFLRDQHVTADKLLELLKKMGRAPAERADTLDRIMRRGHEVALVADDATVTSLHVLVALCSFVDSTAYQLMSTLGVDMATMRNTALSYLAQDIEVVDPDPQPVDGYATITRAAYVAPMRRDTAAHRDFAATQGPMTSPPAPHFGARPHHDPATNVAPPARANGVDTFDELPGTDETEETYEQPPRREARGLREPEDVRRRRRLARGRAATRATEPSADTTRTLAARLYGAAPIAPKEADGVSRDNAARGPEATAISTSADSRPATKRSSNVPRHQLVLRENQYPLLAKLGRNLSLLAFDMKLDRVFGRDQEIEQLLDVLNKRRANNPVLVGDPGVGKTAVVEGLAHLCIGADGERPPSGLEGRIIVELEASRMIAGTGMRGSFSERMQTLKNEVAKADGKIIVFLDELHQWIGMGAGGDGPADGAGELKTALARGTFPCIGATTFAEYRKFIESDPAFERRFQIIRVDEPSPEDAIAILGSVARHYATHHDTTYDKDAIDAAVRLSHRYLPDRRLPDKAISVLDLAGSRARRIGAASVGRPLVTAIVAEQAGLEPDKLLMADRERFLHLETHIMKRIVGHTHVVERVAQVLRRNYAGFVSGRPIGSFLLLGPTGVGKTELAKSLAAVVFDDESSMLRVDMSEYMEAHTVARLIGSPPGYVGHEAGGQLTEPVRRSPYQLVLFDEVEKAHPDVLNILIQLLDEGRLTDSRGRTVDFSSTIVMMTSNLGADELVGSATPRSVGFSASNAERSTPAGTTLDGIQRVITAARRHFRPELWNRIDDPLVFFPLERDDVARIARLQLVSSSNKLHAERQIAYSCAPEVIDFLIENGGYDPELGARPMRRTIERTIESAIASMILRGDIEAPAQLEVAIKDGEVTVDLVVAVDV